MTLQEDARTLDQPVVGGAQATSTQARSRWAQEVLALARRWWIESCTYPTSGRMIRVDERRPVYPGRYVSQPKVS